MNCPTKCAATYLALLFAGSGHAAAFALPSFAPNCADPLTQSEINMCVRAEHEAADKAMTSIYGQVIEQLREQDHSIADLGPAYVGAELLIASSQQAWSTGRADFCSAAGQAIYGGSMRPAIVATCFAMLAGSRTEELGWLLE
jgi:uncharacterized protein YecT (DUF1311 family)